MLASRSRHLALAALLALPVLAPALDAQARDSRRVPRKLLFAVGGALVAGAAASAYIFTTEEGRSFGTCSSGSCVATVSLVSGSLVGYMIGREFDELYGIRFRNGRPLDISNVSASVESSALGLAAQDSLVAVSVAGGVQLYVSSPRGLRSTTRRAGGVRNIAALDLAPGNGALAVGSPAGFYVFPPVTGPGLLLREGASTAVATTRERAYFGVGSRVEVAPLGADTTRTWPGADVGAPVRALMVDDARGLVWAATDSAVVALRPEGDSLAVAGRAPTDAPVRALDARGSLLVGALGEAGLRAWDVSNVAAPVERGSWRTARFVYGAAIVEPRKVLVAGGTEGMYVLDLSGATPAVVGLARDMGFVTNVLVRGQHAFLLDRYGDLLRRFDVSAF